MRELLNKSNKPLAIEFKFEIFNNIMPTLRKTGEYIISNDEKKLANTVFIDIEIDKLLNKTIKNDDSIVNAKLLYIKNNKNI